MAKYTEEQAQAIRKQKAASVGGLILNAFESGKVEAALANVFLNCGGRHADAYSWRNRMLVALHGYSDAMGFKQWLAVGRCVKKGERSFLIWGAMIFKKEDKKTGEVTTRMGFKTLGVFGLEQTTIIDEAKWTKHNEKNEQAENVLASLPFADVAKELGLTVVAYDGKRSHAAGWFSPTQQTIGMGVENPATFAHELIHAADHRLGKLVEKGQHWRSETVAELGGAILLTMMGYEREADTGGAWKYIQRYALAADIKPLKACTDVLDRTCEAVALILQTAEKLGCDSMVAPAEAVAA